MKTSSRLIPVLDKARENEQAAAGVLADAATRQEGAGQKLAELEAYRNEYAEGLRYKTDAGLNALQMRDYQAFLGRLDEAIRQQRQILEGLQAEAEQARQGWLQEKRHLSALVKLNDKHRQREYADDERREQAETNEHALRRWQRAPGG